MIFLDRKSLKIILGTVSALSIFAGFFLLQEFRGRNFSIEEIAARVVEICAEEAYRPSCYDREIPKLGLSLEDVFVLTRMVQTQDPSYQYCHVLGHEVAAQEVRKNPLRWKEVAYRCPTDVCSNGCIHGAFQERFRTDSMSSEEIKKNEPEFKALCESKPAWDPTGITQASCYHALGHLMMYVSVGDIPLSLNLCRSSALKEDGRDYTQLCFDGVFMQIFQPLEPEDFALVKGKQPTAGSVSGFCGKYDGAAKASCLSESWPLFREEVYTPAGAMQFCAKEEPEYQERCRDAIFYVVTAMFNLDSKKMFDYCSAFPIGVRGQCFADAATRMIETDEHNIEKAAAFCQEAVSVGEGDACFSKLVQFSTFVFHAGSPFHLKLCSVVPDSWKGACLARNKK